MSRPDYIQKIIDDNDIVDYLSSQGYMYKSTNGERYKYTCPFHEEKKPSFYVFSSGDPHFYCFGCKVGGDIIDLISGIEKISTKQVIRRLATSSGITDRDMLDSIVNSMEPSEDKYDENKVDELSFKLSVTLYGYLKQVEFDKSELAFIEKTYEKLDKLIQAMDNKSLEEVYEKIVNGGLKARYRNWQRLQDVKRVSITGDD